MEQLTDCLGSLQIDDYSKEIWVELTYDGKDTPYEVSDHGRIRKGTKIMSQHINSGYYRITLFNKGHYVHKIVASCFIDNPENKPTVDHIDHNRLNNHISNLRWATVSEQNINKNNLSETKGRKIWRVDLETNKKIEYYDSVTLAAKWVFDNGLTENTSGARSAISACARNERKFSFGFKWIYEDDEIEDDPDEIWKEIPSEIICGNTGFIVSNKGRLKNPVGRICITTSKECANGYPAVSICRKKYQIHRLVAFTFIGIPEKDNMVVNHIDGNKTNSHLDNLEFITYSDNVKHAHKMGLIKSAKKVVQFTLDGTYITEYDSIAEATRQTSIGETSISRNCHKKLSSTHGFIFRFKNDVETSEEEKEEKEEVKRPIIEERSICQFTKDGEFVMEHATLKDACTHSKLHKIFINWSLKGRNIQGKYMFRYTDECELEES